MKTFEKKKNNSTASNSERIFSSTKTKRSVRFLVAFLALCLVLAAFAPSVFAAEEAEKNEVLTVGAEEEGESFLSSIWFICTVATFAAWGLADLFYKKSAAPEDRYSPLKTSCLVGIVMGGHAIFYIAHMVANGDGTLFEILSQIPIALLKYLPVSAMYILSMTIGYVGLRYIELSVSSPIQNSSGALTAILLVLFGIIVQKKSFFDILGPLDVIGIVLICAGVFGLSLIEKKKADCELIESGEKIAAKYRVGALAVFFPILYCVIDALGTFADGLYLDEYEILSEDMALISYELTFFICAIVIFIHIKGVKKQSFSIIREKNMIVAAVFETVGQVFYVFAMSGKAVVAAPVVASYCVLSVLLSRIVLKEKLSFLQYFVIFVVFAGILLLGLSEGLAEL